MANRGRGRRRADTHRLDRSADRADMVGRCDRCFKYSFSTRDGTRREGRRTQPGAHTRAYQCPHTEGLWHWGVVTAKQLRREKGQAS